MAEDARAAARPATRHSVAGIPLLVVEPDPASARGRLALWQPYLSGSKEAMEPTCRRLAAAGFHAVSFDPWRHGERAEPGVDLVSAVLGQFRRRMWPLLGHSVIDGLQVLDWVLETYGLAADVVAGGVSMGGDVAVALAGVDRRVRRVATIGSTPDWRRPGMTVLADPDRVLDQGRPDSGGRWLFEALDPMTHPGRYVAGPDIAFEFGAEDRHVPAANAESFAAAVRAAGGTAELRVTRHPGLDHLTSGRDDAVLRRCVQWLAR